MKFIPWIQITEPAVYKEDPEQPPIELDPNTVVIHISLDIPPDYYSKDEESR